MRVPSGDQAYDSTSTPDPVMALWLGLARLAWRAASARDRGIDDPDLRPAAPPRDEPESATIGTPARHRIAGRMVCHPGLARAIDLDDPHAAVPDEGEATTVGRPLRIGR